MDNSGTESGLSVTMSTMGFLRLVFYEVVGCRGIWMHELIQIPSVVTRLTGIRIDVPFREGDIKHAIRLGDGSLFLGRGGCVVRRDCEPVFEDKPPSVFRPSQPARPEVDPRLSHGVRAALVSLLGADAIREANTGPVAAVPDADAPDTVPGSTEKAVVEDHDEHTSFSRATSNVLDRVGRMLIQKNRQYGNSALAPIRIFSKLDDIQQILVRIDDKLSRVKSGQTDDTEDVVLDLIGYLVLLMVAQEKQKNGGVDNSK